MDTRTKARVALGIALACAAAWISLNFLPAVLWACVIAIAVDPLRKRAISRFPGHGEAVAAIITVLVALLVVVPLSVGAARGIAEGREVYVWYGRAVTQGIPVPEWVHNLPWSGARISTWWANNLARPEGAREQLHRINAETLLAHGKLLGHSVAERLVLFFFSMTTLFFVLNERDGIVHQLRNASIRAFGPAGERVGCQILASVRGTIDGLVIVGLVEGLIMTIVYAVSGTPHPVLLGALTGVGAMVPFGMLVFVLIAVALLVVKGATVAAICVGIFAFVLNFCADHFVRPVLIGGATKLPFIWVLIGILGGVETIGLLGLFVGPAIMAAFILVWREFSDDRHHHIEQQEPS